MVLPNAILLVAFLCCFQEPPPPALATPLASRLTTKPWQQQQRQRQRGWCCWTRGQGQQQQDEVAEAGESLRHHQAATAPFLSDEHRHRHRRRSREVLWERGGWWCLFTGFAASFQLSALETGLTPISKEHFHWTTMQNSCLFSGLALAALAAILVTIALGRRGRSDREIMALGFAALVSSLLIDLAGCGDPQVRPLLGALCGNSSAPPIQINPPHTSTQTARPTVGARLRWRFPRLRPRDGLEPQCLAVHQDGRGRGAAGALQLLTVPRRRHGSVSQSVSQSVSALSDDQILLCLTPV